MRFWETHPGTNLLMLISFHKNLSIVQLKFVKDIDLFTITTWISGLVPAKKGVRVDYNFEDAPLKIKTDSSAGSNHHLIVFFYAATKEESRRVNVGHIIISFQSTIKYKVYPCQENMSDMPDTLPSEDNKMWKITKTAEPRITIHCNEEEVINILMSKSTCQGSDWSTEWKKKVMSIEFFSADTASDSYIGMYLFFVYLGLFDDFCVRPPYLVGFQYFHPLSFSRGLWLGI